jgi:membrane protein
VKSSDRMRGVAYALTTPGVYYHPMAKRKLSALRIARLALADFFADDMPTYASALAYRVLFSLFPFLIFLTALLGFLGLPEFFDWLREQAAYVLPAEAMNLVNTVLGEVQVPQGGLMSVAVAVAVWSASAAVLGTMDALNVAYEVKERRPAWKRFLVSILYTLALALMLIVAAGMMVTGPAFLGLVGRYVGLDSLFIAVWAWLRWPIAVFALMIVVAIVYWAAPNVKQPFRFITPGSILAVTTWIAASVGFGYYVQSFGNYNKTYGSMAAVVVLLFYFFLSAAVMLFGAEVNAVVMRQKGEPIEEADGGESA